MTASPLDSPLKASSLKYAKRQVRYTDRGTDAEHCSICRHYVDAITCAIVTGDIKPRGWCNKWERRH